MKLVTLYYVISLTHYGLVTWRHGSGPTLAYVMTCCLTEPSNCLNQYWLLNEFEYWRYQTSSGVWNLYIWNHSRISQGKKVNVWKLSDMIIVMRTLPILHVPWFFRKYVNRCWYGMLFVIHICPILWADWMHILWQIIQDKNGKASSSKLPSLICWHRPIHHWPNMAIGSQLTKMDIHKIIIWFWLNIYIILVVLLQKKIYLIMVWCREGNKHHWDPSH